MPDKLGCPLMNMTAKTPAGQAAFMMAACAQEGCLWFDVFRRQCYIVTIAQLLPRGEVKKEDDRLV